MPQHIHKVKYGDTERMCFSKIKDVLPIPYLIELQKDSYKRFITEGIQEVLDEYSPVGDYTGKIELHYIGFYFEDKTTYSVKECKERDATYARPFKVRVRLVRNDTGEVTEEDVFMGDFPMMTENGSFIINGAERVIVSQLVRSPSVYCNMNIDKAGVARFDTTVMPSRGAWLEFKQDQNDVLWVNVDRNRKVLGSDAEIYRTFGEEKILVETIKKDVAHNEEDAKVELYKKMRPGEVPNNESITQLIRNTFYDARRYDLARVGRYKFNKKLSLGLRIAGLTIAKDVVSEDGEVLAFKGDVLDEKAALDLQNSGVNEVYVVAKDGAEFKVIGNKTVDLEAFVDCDPKALGINEKVYYPSLKEMMSNFQGEELLDNIKKSKDMLIIKHLTIDDVLASVSYNLGLSHGLATTSTIWQTAACVRWASCCKISCASASAGWTG